MNQTQIAGKTTKRTAIQPETDTLPQPLGDQHQKELDTIIESTQLMLDKPGRYSAQAAQTAVNLPEERVKALAVKFGSRIRRLPFTIEGIPRQEEIALTQDLWNALKADEQQAIKEDATKVAFPQTNITSENTPDETPYAKRLTHRYLQMRLRGFK